MAPQSEVHHDVFLQKAQEFHKNLRQKQRTITGTFSPNARTRGRFPLRVGGLTASFPKVLQTLRKGNLIQSVKKLPGSPSPLRSRYTTRTLLPESGNKRTFLNARDCCRKFSPESEEPSQEVGEVYHEIFRTLRKLRSEEELSPEPSSNAFGTKERSWDRFFCSFVVFRKSTLTDRNLAKMSKVQGNLKS